MLLKKFLFVLLIFTATLVNGEVAQLSNQSKVLIFTCEPGTELYAGFGHNAIWVSDPVTGVDRLYNFGTFDFNTPNFYWKFIRGKLDYMVSVTSARRFIDEYNYRGIGVTGQQLNLTADEKQQIYSLLETNLLPENKFYKYDFYYDNCATRIRDVVIKVVDGEINFNTADQNLSFRQILLPYLTHTPWTKFGINLVLGLTSDKIASTYHYMYIPEHMMIQFGNATVTNNGNKRKLVVAEKRFLESKLDFSYNVLTDPALLFSTILLLIGLITFIELRRKSYFKWLDVTLNTIGVVAGLFLFFMWVGTDHTATNQNLNILWLFPAQALFLTALFFKAPIRLLLVRISFAVIVLVAFAMFFWPQETEISFVLISLIFAFRYLFHQRISN